ncbi:pyridoxamine 5'-phosphate oxidase family protein [Chitinimonas sp.]|uniref:FAD-binding oxidoreductase n=1 Tax=Chitinimonas sp. TaxID=1934313 RepID=UPI0035B2D2E6
MNDPVSSKSSPWHSGERQFHQRMGTVAQMEAIGQRVIRDFMPDQHRQFFQQLPFIAIGTVDAHGRPWASLIEGLPGFIQSPDPRQLDIGALPGKGDPARTAIVLGQPVGLLGIELHTRRRNRMNGTVGRASGSAFSVQVGHSFGNCPQYIQHRAFSFSRPPADDVAVAIETLPALDEDACTLIRGADTFFVASYHPGDAEHPDAAVDVSHRGGKPGFVHIDGDTLTIPDFAGNLHFNTFGNFLVNPKAGLVFIDFTNGDMLQLSGSAEIDFDSPQIQAFQGAERLWRVKVEQLVRRRGALALRWQLGEFSPNSLMTGSWEDAAAKLQAAALRDAWRPFRLSRVVDESSVVRSFYLEPADNHGIAPFLAGQHLPIRLQLPGQDKPVIRTYTLSQAPSDGGYRISVKRDGLVSQYLHDQLKPGDLLDARAPQGSFTVDAGERRPLVLLAGGIGITPMLAMLRHVVFEGLRKRRVRPTWLFYATRTVEERAFDAELAQLAQQGGIAVRIVRLASQPAPQHQQGRDYEAQGRIDTSLLKSLLPFDDFDFYLCGPSAFTQSLYDGLRAMRINDERIFAEAFGPSGLVRQADHASKPALPAIADTPATVLFSESGKEARWEPGSGSLLDLAEQRGLSPEFGCRNGSCGTCRTKVIEGEVSYAQAPGYTPAADEALICCAMPAKRDGKARIVLKL